MTNTEPSEPALGRVLGLDLGTVRIGLAVSDSRRALASPYGVFRRCATTVEDHNKIREVVNEYTISLIVVGLPLSLSGSDSASSTAARLEVAQLEDRVGIPVLLIDERLSTVEASARRRELAELQNAARRGGRGGRSRTYSKRSTPKGPPVVDDRAAAIILQSYLDRQGPLAKGGKSD